MQRQDDARAYYDELGADEWDRMTRTPADLVSLEIHRRFLERHIEPGWRVLEIGAGPGRFTLQLAELGAHIAVTDISDVQLRLNEERLRASEWESAVESWRIVDVCDTSHYQDDEFDAVVAFGGPLSYAFEKTEAAIHDLLRITNGPLIASVMSLLGTWRHQFTAVTELESRVGVEANDAVLRTGDLRHLSDAAHVCQMFRWTDIEAIVHRAGGTIQDGSASNWSALADPDAVATVHADPVRWAHFLQHEVCACAEPGARDGGTHILFAATRSRGLTAE
ncbi:MAG TPA: methyltransferase domain-containing protein [Mycobacteriales bacterium]|nr:methyltransferase domain-containing protein [Mycobacteriales bacterium]